MNPPGSWNESIQQLKLAWQAGRFPQALLLTGPTGIGKKQLAMDLVAFLTCSNADKRPCGTCFNCKMAYEPGASDHWLVPLIIDSDDRKKKEKVDEATSEVLNTVIPNPYHSGLIPSTASIYVDQVRFMEDRLSLKSTGVRAFIILEADAMNENAANALLKRLEEAPPQTYFILTCSSRHRLMQTIQSRCMPMQLPPLTAGEISTILAACGHQSVGADLLGMSMGSVGKAMQCIEMDLDTTILRAEEFLSFVAGKQWSPLFFSMDEWFSKETDPAVYFLEVLAVLLEDGLRKSSGVDLRLPTRNGGGGAHYSPDQVSRYVGVISEAQNRIIDRRGSVSMILQTMALQFQS
jgi:DNA polymerase-3 subunit delta'